VRTIDKNVYQDIGSERTKKSNRISKEAYVARQSLKNNRVSRPLEADCQSLTSSRV